MSTQIEQSYKRVDVARLSSTTAGAAAETGTPRAQRIDVRWWIIPLSVILCVAQAVATILAANVVGVELTPTLISVLAFGTLFLIVLLLNPLLRGVFREKILRPLNRAEVMCVFTALLVTSGISTFGLTSQLVPFVAGPWNPSWNEPQRGWREDVLPYLNQSLFITLPEAPSGLQQDAGLTLIEAIEARADDDTTGLRVMAGPAVTEATQAQWPAYAGAAMKVRAVFSDSGGLKDRAEVDEAVTRLDSVAPPALAAMLQSAGNALPAERAQIEGADQPARERALELIATFRALDGVSIEAMEGEVTNDMLRARLASLGEQTTAIWAATQPVIDRQIAYRVASLPMEQFRTGLRPTNDAGQQLDPPAQAAPFRDKLTYWGEVFVEVPWGTWMRPLAGWLVFVAGAYGMFYCLTYVALGYWSQREKLIFPLAQLPEQLLPDNDRRRWLPWTLRTSGFWMGFAIVFLLWSWNGAVSAEWLSGLGKINMGMGDGTVTSILQGGIFEGLTGGSFKFEFLIIFTAIGVAFLLPTEISFSIWFYFLVGKAIILALVWFGYGQSGEDFPSGFFGQANTVTAQGGGALLMFAGISLSRAVWDFFKLGQGKSLGEKARLSVPVIGLAISLAVLFGWFWWNDLPFWWALVITAVVTLITIGLMRAVAEGGIYWFQLHMSPMHLYTSLGLGAKHLALAPLIPLYSVLFFDVKTFMAPNLANSAKMQQDVGGSRAKFHLNIILCIVISVVVALAFAIFLAHVLGATQMNGWFYNSSPEYILDAAQNRAAAAPEFDGSNVFSYIFGGAWVLISMFIRHTMFWFPHPIGYVMLINPLMGSLWFSFFLGWIVKKLVVKYGGKQTYDRIRPIFIGVILGELMAVFAWTGLGVAYDFEPGVSLNRYNP